MINIPLNQTFEEHLKQSCPEIVEKHEKLGNLNNKLDHYENLVLIAHDNMVNKNTNSNTLEIKKLVHTYLMENIFESAKKESFEEIFKLMFNIIFSKTFNLMNNIKTTDIINNTCRGCHRCVDGYFGSGVIVKCGEKIILVKHNYGKQDYNDFGGKITKGLSVIENSVKELLEESSNYLKVTTAHLEVCPTVEFKTGAQNFHKYLAYLITMKGIDMSKLNKVIKKSIVNPDIEWGFREIDNAKRFDIDTLRSNIVGNELNFENGIKMSADDGQIVTLSGRISKLLNECFIKNIL